MTNSDSVFERVLHSVGDDGRFQKRSNFIFNFLLAAMATMSYMNLILAATVPDHWCKVPGREEGNFTVEEWKLLTLPRQGLLTLLLYLSYNKKYLMECVTSNYTSFPS